MFSAFQTFGRLGAGARAVAAAWTPAALWPTGTEPGMWIDPSNLDASWADYTGTTPVSTPGTVADSSNPVGLALDLRLGAPDTLGPELVVNGDFSDGATGWTLETGWSVSGGQASITNAGDAYVIYQSGLTPGKTYFASFTATSVTAGVFAFYCGGPIPSPVITSAGTCTAILSCGANGVMGVRAATAGTTGTIDNISFKEIPGNHLLQATSTARPLESARVNLLTYTEDFSNAAWTKENVSLSAPSTTNGVTTTQVTATAANGQHQVSRYVSSTVGSYYTSSVYVKAGTATRVGFLPINNTVPYNYLSANIAIFDLDSGTVVSAGTWNEATITPAENGGYVLTVRDMRPAPFSSAGFAVAILGPGDAIEFLASGTETIHIGWPQAQLGTTATPYQAILTDGSTYPATGFPIFLKYDGTDDGAATATFAAGTLSNAMDCMIAVRRDSAAATVVLGLYAAGTGTCFGVSDIAGGHSANAGTPTVWVDNVQLAGGTNVLAATVNSAVTVGEWHILEFRGLDLSGWTQVQFGGYPFGYALNGGQGGILLFPSSTSAADRDAARTWLGAKVGLTL